MARIAEQLADTVIVTSDNPRTESPEAIIDEIVAGFERGPCLQSTAIHNTHDATRNTKTIEPDRRKAIELAISSARKDDIVLIAGKGHETYQIIGAQKFDFSDRKIAEEYLGQRMKSRKSDVE
jgi:UDP-N-acetylmuramoyl-L-alanyl-D-glutamate--2,6-diaminopimelate ligase